MRSLVQTFIAGVAGALTVVVLIGATDSRFNQIAAAATGVALSDTGITFPDGSVQVTAAPHDPRRAFYQTIAQHSGIAADNPSVCASGFHFASLWEIHDVSNLRYATDTEGAGNVVRLDDSGQGPPSAWFAWIRTGYQLSTVATGGYGNCRAWASASSAHRGTIVGLKPFWEDTPESVAPWEASDGDCSNPKRVWCVEDSPGAASS
jgi:hypothetical protein